MEHLTRSYSQEAKEGQFCLLEMIVHYQKIAEGVARQDNKNHRLGEWKKDNGEYFGYGYYALCAHEGCTVYGWVTDRDSINPLRGSIYWTEFCPVKIK